MKKISTIVVSFLFTAFVLTSCGDESPTACDCAKYEFEMDEEFGSPDYDPDNADASIEAISEYSFSPEGIEKWEQLEKKWEPKLKPCKEKVELDPSFQKAIDECLFKKQF